MRLLFKPDHTSNLESLLESENYKKLWKQNSRKTLKAFRDITGLDFQQKIITARIGKVEQSIAGSYHYPMRLRLLIGEPNDKLVLLIHELSHRLLGGNALGVVNLGLVSPENNNSNEANEYDHRHTYLFEYDVVKLAFGKELADTCLRFEGRKAAADDINGGSHQKAWEWAMAMTFEERQKSVKKLAAKAIPRNEWADSEDKEIIVTSPKVWFNNLTEK
jgi:hypothetical protein